jgi:hypothetical protein
MSHLDHRRVEIDGEVISAPLSTDREAAWARFALPTLRCVDVIEIMREAEGTFTR